MPCTGKCSTCLGLGALSWICCLDLRYHKLLAGASWQAEYGNPDSDDWNNFLYKYSPYHNIDESREKYPHVLVTTSTRDDRVHPAHARKMVKKMWDLSGVGSRDDGDSNGETTTKKKRKKKDWPVFYYETRSRRGDRDTVKLMT